MLRGSLCRFGALVAVAAAAVVVLGPGVVVLGPSGGPAAASVAPQQLYTAGLNDSGQLGVGDDTGPQTCPAFGEPCSPAPVVPSLPAGVAAGSIVAESGDAFTVGSNGVLYGWGSNSEGQLGTGSLSGPSTCSTGACSEAPVPVDLPTAALPPTQVVTDGGFTLALGADGTLYGWGDDIFSMMGNGQNAPPASCTGEHDWYCPTPTVIDLPSGATAQDIALNAHAAYAVTTTGTLYSWGFGDYGELGTDADIDVNDNPPSLDTNYPPAAVDLPAGVTATGVWADTYSAYADGSDGNVYSWGLNGYGQLGHGENPALDAGDEPDYATSDPWTVDLPSKVQLSSLVQTGSYTTYAIGTDGDIYVWGDNQDDFGNGSTQTTSTVPETVSLPGGISPVALAAATGYYSSVPAVDVVGADGLLYEWGQSEEGEFADGNASTEDVSTPTANPWLSDVQAVAAGTSLLLVKGKFTPPFLLSPDELAAKEDIAATLHVAGITPGVGISTTASTFTATVDWGDGSSDATGTLVPSNGSYEVEAPHAYAATGTYDVTTTVTGLGYTTSVTSQVTVGKPPKPTLTSVSPDAVGQGATKTLTLKGSGITTNDTASVSFSASGVAVDSVTYDSPTRLSVKVVVSKTATVGPGNVTLTTAGGSKTCTGCLTVDAAPTITQVAGTLTPGTASPVTVSGTGFQAGLTVKTNISGATVGTPSDVTATSFQVSITAPGGTAAGAHTLTVTNPDGGSATSAKLDVS